MCLCVSCRAQLAILDDSVILGAIDATIATRFCTVLATEWLAGKSVGDCLYRGSVDGMTPFAFHERCDERGPTLTLIRADEGGRVCVFGGYTSAPWCCSFGHVSRADAFLFSVTGPHCSVTQFPVRPEKQGAAVACSPRGCVFFGGPDFILRNLSGSANGPFDAASRFVFFGDPLRSMYTDVLGLGRQTFTGTTDAMGRFTPVDIEVYAIV